MTIEARGQRELRAGAGKGAGQRQQRGVALYQRRNAEFGRHPPSGECIDGGTPGRGGRRRREDLLVPKHIRSFRQYVPLRAQYGD